MFHVESEMSENSKKVVRHKVAYLMTLFGIAVFTTACFFKFAVDVVFFMATVDLRYAHYYIYGGIIYLIFSIVLIFHVSRCVVIHTIESFDKIQQIKDEEKKLNEIAILETI
uniref:Serpentine receptor class gamma n=1 Tax=Caenorhabditis tropicalis TaxID=1561998 RepID=A0A1I7TX72_9PELO